MRAHDGVSDLVGFALFGIVGMTDRELGANESRAQQILHRLIAGLLLQLKDGRKRRTFGQTVQARNRSIVIVVLLPRIDLILHGGQPSG